MRLRRLDLTRYGHFTDMSLDLPASKPDFHVIYGLNEAGKSTALNAIEDLLFGIPVQSPYNFLHDYSSMRIGAELQNSTSSIEVHRRKGKSDTLLDADGSPIVGGENSLKPYLAGADRTFFQRMFNLDHSRLKKGGQEILEAKDDIGHVLFSAGAGIAGLRERLGKLDTEADELFSTRRAKYRKFYIAYDKFKEAQGTLQQQVLTANRWKELKRAYEKAEEAYDDVDKKVKEANTERNRLIRIRRVFSEVRKMQEIEIQLAELGDIIVLPENAAMVVEEAERGDVEKAARISTLQKQLDGAKNDLKDLTFDKVIIQRSKDIKQLHERRIEIRNEKADLPKRKAELAAAEKELNADASELGWPEADSETLVQRIPPNVKVRTVRSLLNQRGELESDVANCTRELRDSQESLKVLKGQLDELGEPADVSRLAIAIRTLREKDDITGKIHTAEQTLKISQGRVKHRLKALNPGGIDKDILTNMTVPAKMRVREFRDREQDWKRHLREAKREALSVQQKLDGAVAAFERSMLEEKVVTGEELHDARSYRDELWNLVNLTHVRGEAISEEQTSKFEQEMEDLAGAFESSMYRADNLSDHRFDHAEAAGRIAEIKRQIGELEKLLEQENENEAMLVEEGKQLQEEWKNMWDDAPFDPLTTESMLEWLEAREATLNADQEREESETALTALQKEEREAREQLLNELSALGVEVVALENDSLRVIIEHAAEEQRLRETEIDKKARVEDEVDNATRKFAQRNRDFHKAKDALNEWQTKWTVALGELGLSENMVPEAIGALLDIIDEMRQTAGRIRSLRHDRINKIKRDIKDFEHVVSSLVTVLADDLLGQSAENSVLELENRLTEALQVQGLREKKIEQVEELKIQIDELENQRRELAASVSHLKTSAMVDTNDELKEAIEQSNQKRSFEKERSEIIEKLQQDGDGKSIEELKEECDEVVIDDVVAREKSIQMDLEDLRKQQTDAAEKRSQAREAFQSIGGDDAAARAAASKQEAIAEIQEAANRYVRVKTSAMLLQWAIDRYRREKQTPLLKRAGELFKTITRDSFLSLQVEYDNNDKAHLTGVRPDGSVVTVSDMSDGTSDQLYLALRIASIKDYLERAEALPFVADDLFINFDDERAAAGFELLGDLSQTTQVLFFTHHQHLVEIARKTLGLSISVANIKVQ